MCVCINTHTHTLYTVALLLSGKQILRSLPSADRQVMLLFNAAYEVIDLLSWANGEIIDYDHY